MRPGSAAATCWLCTRAGRTFRRKRARGPLNGRGENSLPLLLVDFDPLALPEVAANSRERCYGCKKGLIVTLRMALRETESERDESRRLLCDGAMPTNLRAFRPGLRALAEARGAFAPGRSPGCPRKPSAPWPRPPGWTGRSRRPAPAC